MGASHMHHAGHDHTGEVPVSSLSRLVLLLVLGVMGVLTLSGLVTLWPQSDPHPSNDTAAYAAPGVTFPHADVLTAEPACTTPDQSAAPGSTRCGRVTVKVRTGRQIGQVVTIPVAPEVSRSGLARGAASNCSGRQLHRASPRRTPSSASTARHRSGGWSASS